MVRLLKTPSDIAPAPRLMESLYIGTCKCSKPIQTGEQIWYDPLTKKVECYTCGRTSQANAQSGLSLVADIDEAQALIDRINNLLHLPERSSKADAEIAALTKKLKRLAKTDKNALKYLRTGKDGNAFIVRYTGVCRKCRTTVEKGEAAVYINNAIICSKCGTA
ncbi:MAG: hypothetical protein IT343_05095 [Candidatus Melainabacteria bacterium]|nr:hypothetical protein [Candidatus Melainabacteria bacterium]